MSRKGRVLVAMSGGIDSTLVAVMLHEQGYEVVGMTLKTWSYQLSGGNTKKETGCCSLDSINDARNIAVTLGFPHYVIDIQKDFQDYVINNFVSEYMSGRTPNPCVLCNTHIKWDLLIDKANQLDCEHIATGHYANLKKNNDRYYISKGIDATKDQSYALWGISQESLKRTLLPLGTCTKEAIKATAREKGFVDIVAKPESYEICFVPDNDYRGFLKRKAEKKTRQLKGGKFILKNGEVVGEHEGYPFYTIGQRKGLGIALGFPAYVTKIKKETNEVVLGSVEELMLDGMWVDQLNFQKYVSLPQKDFQTLTKIRYNDKGTLSKITQLNDKLNVKFEKGVNSIAPGQAAVFYEKDDVIGGGWIKESFLQSQK